MEDEQNPFELPEETVEQCIDKINALAVAIRLDWNDPRSECRYIYGLCDKLKVLLKIKL